MCVTHTVGASLLAMVVNDAAGLLTERSALESIASKLAPTVWVTHMAALFASIGHTPSLSRNP